MMAVLKFSKSCSIKSHLLIILILFRVRLTSVFSSLYLTPSTRPPAANMAPEAAAAEMAPTPRASVRSTWRRLSRRRASRGRTRSNILVRRLPGHWTSRVK